MKRIIYPLLLVCTLLLTAGCESYETYSDLKEKEQHAINQFISDSGISVIDETTFNAQGQTTDVSKNQFVRFSHNGVYMQIVRKGVGTPIAENTKEIILCRFLEKNLETGTIEVRNDINSYVTLSGVGTVDVSQYIDKMKVTRTGSTIQATFIEGLMYQYHASSTVPSGWLVPLNYVNVDAYAGNVNDEIAKVKLIVPHSQGSSDATASVVPYYYEITYQRAL